MTTDNQETRKNRDAALMALIRPLPNAIWTADFPLNSLEGGLDSFAKDWGGCNLEPDFQRGHVWNREQQERYVEAMYRGTLPSSGLLVQFNCPHWDDENYQGDLPREVQCIDGLQRLTALRKFLKGEINAFGMPVQEFTGTRFCAQRSRFFVKFAMFSFGTKAELLQHYLDINAGGTPHSAEEIARIREMLANLPALQLRA